MPTLTSIAPVFNNSVLCTARALQDLTPRTPYFVRAACDNAGVDWSDVIGSVTSSTPQQLVPLPPRITALSAASAALLCVGGQAITLYGTRLGRASDVALLTLVNQRAMAFQSAPCVHVVDLAVLSCVSPSGVGANLTAFVTVDGVDSDVFTDFTLSYRAPSITAMTGAAASGGSTAGGVVVLGAG